PVHFYKFISAIIFYLGYRKSYIFNINHYLIALTLLLMALGLNHCISPLWKTFPEPFQSFILAAVLLKKLSSLPFITSIMCLPSISKPSFDGSTSGLS